MLAVVLTYSENDLFFWTGQKVFLSHKFQHVPASLKGMLFSSFLGKKKSSYFPPCCQLSGVFRESGMSNMWVSLYDSALQSL